MNKLTKEELLEIEKEVAEYHKGNYSFPDDVLNLDFDNLSPEETTDDDTSKK